MTDFEAKERAVRALESIAESLDVLCDRYANPDHDTAVEDLAEAMLQALGSSTEGRIFFDPDHDWSNTPLARMLRGDRT